MNEIAHGFKTKLGSKPSRESAWILCDPAKVEVVDAKADACVLMDRLLEVLTEEGFTCVRGDPVAEKATHAVTARVKGATSGSSRTFTVTVELVELATKRVVATSIKEFRTSRS